jgi:hypothetical protein
MQRTISPALATVLDAAIAAALEQLPADVLAVLRKGDRLFACLPSVS